MPKLILDFLEEYPYEILGISCTAHDYRLCWNLNKKLGISLKRENEIDIANKQNDLVAYSYFAFEDDLLQVKYRLIENKKGSAKFLPEVPHADYLFVIDESPAIDTKEILELIKEIRSVLMVFNVDITSLKHKQNLLLTA